LVLDRNHPLFRLLRALQRYLVLSIWLSLAVAVETETTPALAVGAVVVVLADTAAQLLEKHLAVAQQQKHH
jgi:hypothetical protein